MESNLQKFREKLAHLVADGEMLRVALARDLYGTKEVTINGKVRLIDELELPSFEQSYEDWYSVGLEVLRQVLPDRVSDFVKLYRDDKRKEIDFLTYGVADHLIGLQTSWGVRTIADGKAAYPKFEQQVRILRSAEARLDSALADMVEVLQADLFDGELDTAAELLKKGHLRAAGVIGGVVLEKHLRHVCTRHGLKTRKKRPTINDFNSMLKDSGAIDLPQFRQIQYLADIRNLCGHDKERDPTPEEVQDLLSGVAQSIKNLF